MGLRRTEHGVLTVSDPGADRPLLESKTVQCCHCGGQFVPEPGSGKIRGFCFNCSGPICGSGCVNCVPTEQMLENIEKGRELDFKPIIVPFNNWGE